MENSKLTKNFILFGVFFITFACILVYLIIRISLFFLTDYHWYEKILAFSLLFAESFILIHSVGYFSNVLIVKRQESTKSNPIPLSELSYYPPVAIVIASYKEPLPILRDTLICFYNISYPNKHLYFLDDTRYDFGWNSQESSQSYRQSIEKLCQWYGVSLFRSVWHGAKAGKINDFLYFLSGNQKPGFEFQWNEDKEKEESEKYLIVFDADMNPLPNFAEELVAKMEKNPNAAFIQTPQYYTNFETSRVAKAAGIQQAVFFEYICEGKGLKNAMFCCGTNVLFRIEALMSVGGFDETSVTEDFATSLKMHGKGWDSLYTNKILAFGMGPGDLGAYFKQQFRWATGTIGILRKLPFFILQNFPRFTINQAWEYFLASTHYLIGWVFFIMFICPIFYLIFNVPRYLAYPGIYIMAYTPYIVVSTFLFFWTMVQRKYRPSDVIPALLINSVTFPVYMKASFYALLGIKTKFGVTPKEGRKILPLTSFIPQIFVCMVCVFVITWGFQRLYFEKEPRYAILMNMFWTLYNFITVSFFLYFNHDEQEI